eukprot:CAMPEP_0119518516 /NCGR_PEP_ID=MMETSP1344-20130328/35102_1 /TAXON_ID=236787 /ORGANISM="Florenciella parvula, Strain CCMP2471" /LENGTH=63 /DNA_ID=CAMNT_0007556209 /DNA_START=124 /DNA_END=311 /DNA_ORIENTATION=-
MPRGTGQARFDKPATTGASDAKPRWHILQNEAIRGAVDPSPGQQRLALAALARDASITSITIA